MSAPLIEFRNVSKVFGGGFFDKNRTVALEKFSMTLDDQPPLITAIVGESGSGKTTLARLLLGLETPTEGQVLFRGKDIHRMNKAEHREFLHNVQFIFQDPFGVYNPFYRVDHILLKPLQKFNLARSRRDAYRMIEEALETVGLRPEETLGRYPHQISGGQRQRIMVARSLLLKPKLIVADEPVSMVDASLRATILGNIQRLNEEFGISIIYITHDLATGYQISHNMLVLYHGAVSEVGDVDLVVNEPLHPYTQLLMNSIPQAVPERMWHRDDAAPTPTRPAADFQGCKFANRCPHVMEHCRTKHPPLYQTDKHRAVACYLYEKSGPTLATDGLEKVFIK
ncbi:MAG: ABC transporter ATP-binding protein [Chloroflexi bacterium]|nr:MAG: ABC transporter ATP-binding protein [Chloroflexota bacterium]